MSDYPPPPPPHSSPPLPNQALLEQISEWHSARQYPHIIQAIRALPADQRTNELTSLLARALFNVDELDAAIRELDSIAGPATEDDPWYCLRRALTLWPQNREDEALPWFRKAQQLGLEEIDELPGTFYPTSVAAWVDRAEKWAPRRVELNAYLASRRAARVKTLLPNDLTAADLDGLWDDCDYSLEKYVGRRATDADFTSVEAELGYRLPDSYKWLIRQHNGGELARHWFRNPLQRDWASTEFSVSGLYGVDRDKPYSLCGRMGAQFWLDNWEYPAIGVAIADTISAGHEMIFLDYTDCGPEGEPCVVQVDQESNYEVSYLADSFADLIRGLVATSVDDEDDEADGDDRDGDGE